MRDERGHKEALLHRKPRLQGFEIKERGEEDEEERCFFSVSLLLLLSFSETREFHASPDLCRFLSFALFEVKVRLIEIESN